MNSNDKKNSWTVRIIAFLVACGLWLYVMNEQNPLTSKSFTVPLAKTNLSNVLVVTDLPENVEVKISAPRGILSNLQEGDVQAFVDFDNATKGRGVYTVHALSKSGEVVEVSPSLLQLDLDEVGERELELEPRIVGVPDSGITVGKLIVSETQVKVRGAQARLNAIDKLIVLVDISAQDKSFTEEATVAALDKDGRQLHDVEITPSTVQVQAEIVKQLVSSDVNVAADVIGKLPEGLEIESVTVTPKTVKLTGDPKLLNAMKDIKTAQVDLSQLTTSVEIERPLVVPEKVLADGHTALVNIKIRKSAPPNEQTNATTNEPANKTQTQ